MYGRAFGAYKEGHKNLDGKISVPMYGRAFGAYKAKTSGIWTYKLSVRM